MSRERSRVTAALSGVLMMLAFGAPSHVRAEFIGSGESAFARQDFVRSAAIFMRRAQRGNAEAQTYLGYMYTNGRGVPQDYEAAVRWLRRAADQGNPTGQFLLGLLYDKGEGVKQDFPEAYFWLNLAAAHASIRQRDYWTRIRNAVASNLTLDELSAAQNRAVAWRPTREREARARLPD